MNESMAEGASNAADDPRSEPVEPRAKKIQRRVFLGILFVILLFVFTLLKLSQSRITGLIQGYVQVGLDPFGIYMSDQGRELSIIKGIRYTLTKPSLELADQTRIELDDLTVSPTFTSLASGKMGVSASLHQGLSEILINAAGRGDKIDLNLSLTDVDLGKMGVFAYLASMKGAGIVSGTVQVAGTLSDPASLEGDINLKIKRLRLDEQNLMGFQLPTLNVSDGTIRVQITGGKLLIKTFQIGKTTDDLNLALTGDILLKRNVNSSLLNLRAVFGLSDKVKQSLAILDSILGGAKMTDGRYAYKLTGTLAAPFPNPDPTGK